MSMRTHRSDVLRGSVSNILPFCPTLGGKIQVEVHHSRPQVEGDSVCFHFLPSYLVAHPKNRKWDSMLQPKLQVGMGLVRLQLGWVNPQKRFLGWAIKERRGIHRRMLAPQGG